MAAKRPPTRATARSAAKKPRAGHWSMGLLAAMEDPEQVVESDELCVHYQRRLSQSETPFSNPAQREYIKLEIPQV